MTRTSRLGCFSAIAALVALLSGCPGSTTAGLDGGTATTGGSSGAGANGSSTGSAVNGGSTGVAASSGGSGGGASSGGSTGSAASSGGSSGGSTGAVTAAQACSDYANASCGLIQSCSDGFDIEVTQGTLADCVARYAGWCANRLALPAPPSGLSPTSIESCAQALPTQTCIAQDGNSFVSACLVPGTGAIGDACTIDAQCASDHCATGTNAVCGTCQAMPVAGADCSTVGCGIGMICLHSSKLCSAPVEDGGACGDPADCEYGFNCTSGDGGTHLCVPGEALGAPCTDLVGPLCQFREGLYCSKDSGVCTPDALADAGQACGTLKGVVTDCAYSGFCADGGTCLAVAADGDGCDSAAGPNCLPLSKCVPTGTGTVGICTPEASSLCGGGSTGGSTGGGTTSGGSTGGSTGGTPTVTYLVNNDQVGTPFSADPSWTLFTGWLNGAPVPFTEYDEPVADTTDANPTGVTLDAYKTVIWFTGDEENDTSPFVYTIDASQQAALEAYLDTGNVTAVIFSELLAYDIGVNSWTGPETNALLGASYLGLKGDFGDPNDDATDQDILSDATVNVTGGSATLSNGKANPFAGLKWELALGTPVLNPWISALNPGQGANANPNVDILATVSADPNNKGTNIVAPVAVANTHAGALGTSTLILVGFPVEDITNGLGGTYSDQGGFFTAIQAYVTGAGGTL